MDTSSSRTGGAPPKAPLWAKLTMGLGVAFLMLLALEGILALAGVQPILYRQDPYVGFSGRIPLFAPGLRDGVPWRVTAANKLGHFNHQAFPENKPEGTLRIFCLGGSTTYGRPYLDSTSFAGWMRELLPGVDPSRQWEVINAGGVSYASYRVAAVMEELLAYRPDLFVIYTGHNEFLERRTYSSLLERPALVRSLGALASGTRVHAALSQALGAGPPEMQHAPTELTPEVETILADAIGPRDYHRDDAYRDEVFEHYRFNLERMIDMAQSVGARVVLVTPASNLASCSPFKSSPTDGVPEAAKAEAIALRARAAQALSASDAATALTLIERASELDPRFAAGHALRGRALEQVGRPADAAVAFTRARDEDVCALRAPSGLISICREVAAQRDVPLVDFAARLGEWSAPRAPGEDWFLDHVHPTIEGHRRLALEILTTLRDEGILPDRGFDPELIDRIRQQVEDSIDLRSHGVALRNLAKVLRWAGKTEEAEALAQRALALLPRDSEALYQMGLAARAHGRAEEAVGYLRDALDANPDLTGARLELGLALRDADRLGEGIGVLEEARTRTPGDPRVHNNLGLLLADAERGEEAIASYRRCLELDPGYAKAHNNLGNVHLAQDRLAEAIASFRAALQRQPDYILARANLGLALARRGEREEAAEHYRRTLELDPSYVEAHYGLGVLAGQAGRDPEAIAHLERVLELDPTHERSRRLLEGLRRAP